MFRRLKPIQLYLISIGCILGSRIFEEFDIAIMHYLFVAVALWFFILALKRYFGKEKT